MKNNWVEVTDWHTDGQDLPSWQRGQEEYFKPPRSGIVHPGPVTPLETNFDRLTPKQKRTLQEETNYWLRVEYDIRLAKRLLDDAR